MKKKLLLVLIALLFVGVLTGCKKDKTNEVENKTEENNTVVDPAQKEAEDAILKEQQKNLESNYNNYKDIEVGQDDTKIVFQNGNSKVVYYYEGNNITGYETYTNFATSDVANFALQGMNANTNANIEKAYVSDTALVVVYKKSAYENRTLEDVKKEYEHIEEVKNEN